MLGGLASAMRKSLWGRLHAGLLWEGGLRPARGVPRGRMCLPVGRGRLCLLGLSEWGGGRVSLVCWGGGRRGGGFWARRVPTLGSCFSRFVPLPTASLLPGRAPAQPSLHPHPWRCEHNPGCIIAIICMQLNDLQSSAAQSTQLHSVYFWQHVKLISGNVGPKGNVGILVTSWVGASFLPI